MNSDKPVILVTHTIMDGPVVRWYRSVSAAEIHAETLSASRVGVLTGRGVYLTDIPDRWLATARDAHQQLARNRDADVRHLATHRHRHVMNGPLEPIPEQEEVASDG